MLRLSLIAFCLISTLPAKAAALIPLEIAVDFLQPLSWDEKVKFVGKRFRTVCKGPDRYCLRIASDVDGLNNLKTTLVTSVPGAPGPVFRQWCVEYVGTERRRCGDEPEDKVK